MKPFHGKLKYLGDSDGRVWYVTGTLSYIIRVLFADLPHEKREKVLARLQTKHEKLTAKEAT